MTLCEPEVGDIWLAYVEFSDHPGVGKVRPVVVVDVLSSTCLVVAAKVTSKDLRQSRSGNVVPIIDWGPHAGPRGVWHAIMNAPAKPVCGVTGHGRRWCK